MGCSLVWWAGRRAGWSGVVDRLCVVEGGEGAVVEAAAGGPLPWWWRAGCRNRRHLPLVLAWGGEALSGCVRSAGVLLTKGTPGHMGFGNNHDLLIMYFGNLDKNEYKHFFQFAHTYASVVLQCRSPSILLLHAPKIFF